MPGHKRRPKDRTADTVLIEALFLKGLTVRAIAAELSKQRSYSLTHGMIQYELNKLDARWKKESLETRDQHKRQQTRAIQAQMAEAWAAWEQSKKESVRTTQEQRKPGEGESQAVRAMVVKETNCGDPRFMDIIIRLREQLIKLLGLDEPIKLDVDLQTTVAERRDDDLERIYSHPRFATPFEIEITPTDAHAGNGNGQADKS